MTKAKRNEEEIQATCQALPLQPPEDVIKEIKNTRLKDGILIYKASWWTDPLTEEKEQTALVHCTNCGAETHLQKISYSGGCSRSYYYAKDRIGFIDPADNTEKYSGNTCICPKCQTGMNALHVSKINPEYTIDRYSFLTAKVVRNHYVILGWQIVKKCNKKGNIWYNIHRTDAMTVIDKTPIRFTGYITGCFHNVSFINGWIARSNYFTDYDTWNWTNTFGLRDQDTVGTELEKSGIIEFFERSFNYVPLAAYIKLWIRYPNVENLIRSGHGAIINKIIAACTVNCGWYVTRNVFYVNNIKNYINVKKVKPHEILNLEKDELWLADNCNLKQIDLYRRTKETDGVRLTIDELNSASKFQLHNTIELIGMHGQKIRKILRYLDKQVHNEKNRPDLIKADYLYDYWRITSHVYDGNIPKELLYPKNLRTAHDRITKLYETKKSVYTQKGIETFAKEMSKLSFKDEETGLLIRPIATQTELIKEGKSLSHCVASYANDYAAKKTCIFAIRKITAPTKPYFTLELKNGAVTQNRGKHNCARTDEIKLFEEKWLNFIKKQGAL